MFYMHFQATMKHGSMSPSSFGEILAVACLQITIYIVHYVLKAVSQFQQFQFELLTIQLQR